MKTAIAFALLACCPASALAQDAALPEPLQALLEAAAADSDPGRFNAALELIGLTQSPEALIAGAAQISPAFADQARTVLGLAAQPVVADAPSTPVTEQEQEQEPGPEPQSWRSAPRRTIATLANGDLDLWTGQLRLGFRQDNGNSDQLDYTAALSVERDLSVWGLEAGLDYRYAETDGAVGRDALNAQTQLDREIGERWTMFVGARYEQDALSGFDWSTLIDAGLGYRVLMNEPRTWRIQIGPALRFLSPVSDELRTEAAAELSSDFDWQMSDALKFTSDSVLLFANQPRFEQNLALQSRLGDMWAVRLAYRFRNEFDPEPGFDAVDTRTDLSIVRDF